MKKFTQPLKNVVPQSGQYFSKFLDHFNTLKKVNVDFYKYDDRNVDINFIQGEAKRIGIKDIPTKEELDNLI